MSKRLLITLSVVMFAFFLLHAQPPAGKKYAVLVGITKYRHTSLTELKHTENDVEEMAKLLKSRMGYTRVRVLTTTRGKKNAEDAPTAENIQKALTELRADKGRDDTVLMALSGHGGEVEVPDPDGKTDNKTYSYFFPADADFENISYSTGVSKRLVSLNGEFERLAKCGAGDEVGVDRRVPE